MNNHTRSYYIRRATEAFPDALEMVGFVLHMNDGARGSEWKNKPWRDHLDHERGHVIGAEVIEDRGGEPSELDMIEHQSHGTTRALMRLQRYLETKVI